MVSMNSDSAPDPSPVSRSAQRRSRLVWTLTAAMVASWLLSLAPLPYSLLAGLTALVALVLLIPLIVQSAKERRVGMVIVGALLGVPVTLVIIAGSVISLAFYGPVAELEQCLSTALTEQARIRCEADAQGSMASWINALFGG